MIELHVSEQYVSSGSVAVTWCVTPELLKHLAHMGITDPQLVICVSPDGDHYSPSRETRQVVSLRDLMAYVEFKSAGPNRITGVISHKGKRECKEKYLSKEHRQYTTDILNPYGDDYALWLQNSFDAQLTLAEPVFVEVPKQCFAPEPAEWEKTWVNHFFSNRCDDQCDFRRRRLFAYSIQPLLMVLFTLSKFLPLAIATLIGARNWSLKYIVHPLTYELRDSWSVMGGGSIFIRELPEDENDAHPPLTASYVARKLMFLPFMPLVMGLITLMVVSKAFFSLTMVVLIVAIFFFIVAFFASGTATKVFNTILDWLAKTDADWYQDQNEIELLVCGQKKAKKLSQLPANKRTLKLRFLDLKSKVCRPFSG